MDSFVIGLAGFGALIALIVIGVPIAFAGAFVGTMGLFVIGGAGITFHYLGSLPYSEVSSYAYTTLPLYILLGEFALYGGYAHGAYRTGREWLGRIPGGQCIATIMGGAGFGAVCGASVASSAVLSKICIPEMKEHGYDTSLAAGTVASSANLASMVPPSGLMIIYSIFTEQSLGKLFMAGVLPGILLAVLFSISVYGRVLLNPKLAPPSEKVSWRQRFDSLRYSWGIFLIAAIVLGGIYTGAFTATEAGGAGAFVAFLLNLFSRSLTWSNFKDILLNGMRTTVMVIFIVVGIQLFTSFLTLSRVPIILSSFLTSLPISPVLLICLILVVYLFLGMFFDAVSMIALTVPVLLPTIVSLGFDPIWFGVVCVLMCEVGLITPPVGINCFVVAGVVPDLTVEEVFRGVIIFILADLVAVALMIIFPQISLFLPNLMAG
ncbi:MAG: TRAP transporter large permease [Syntrophaceae bacterium]|nr:TRAP transporter large permease [Syntrophaceae bacterium]